MAWSPEDLTSIDFVKQQMSPTDRDFALQSTSRELNSVTKDLPSLKAAADAAYALYYDRPTRESINILKAKAADTALTQAARDAAAAEAVKLQNERDRLSAASEEAGTKYRERQQYFSILSQGQSNLLSVGTVDTVNVPAYPPGNDYNGTVNPPKDVPNSSNPSNPAVAKTELPENSVPAAVSTASDPAQRAAAAAAAADQAAIDQAKTTNNVQDPQQRQQNVIIESEVPAKISTFQDPAQRAAAQQEEIQNSAPAAIPTASDPQQIAKAKADEAAAAADQTAVETARLAAKNTQSGITAAKTDAQSKGTQQDADNAKSKLDWRVRLSLAPGAKESKYLYWADPPGILAPLQTTNGVIFPYTPSISVQYGASYDNTQLTHSNYKFFTYKGSSVDTITIGCDFTAQDTAEAMYILAVIHFFRSATKMFYGQDENPKLGTPPPLCYLTGLGQFQFDAHPLAITGFTYTLPVDVDYIRAGSTDTPAGVSRANNPSQGKPGENAMAQAGASRLAGSGLNPGAIAAPPAWSATNFGTVQPTYVPTKINLSITAVPIITRNDISNVFSLKKYATGELLKGSKRNSGGFW
jgi:hypothetical protein